MSEQNSESLPGLPAKNFVLGLPIHCIDDYSGYLLSRLEKGLGTHVVTLNAEMVMQGEKIPSWLR